MDNHDEEMRMDLDVFKEQTRIKLEHLDVGQAEMNRHLSELSTSMRQLSDCMIRMDERNERQSEINNRVRDEVEAIDKRLTQVETERNQEKQSRDFLSKYWWVLMVVVIGVASQIPSMVRVTV